MCVQSVQCTHCTALTFVVVVENIGCKFETDPEIIEPRSCCNIAKTLQHWILQVAIIKMIYDWKTKAKYHFVSSVGLWSLMLTMMQYMNDEGSCNVD